MILHYILKDGHVVPCPDVLEWAKWFEQAGETRVIAKTHVGTKTVSTIFLGLDVSCEAGLPILWETMVFPECNIQRRYCTALEARKGHAEIVKNLSR